MPSDEDIEETASVAGVNLHRLTSIESVPEPVFLVSFLYVPREGDDIDWHACEFFGRGSDPALRRLVVRVAEDNEGLARQLDRLLGRLKHGDFAQFKRVEEERHSRARRLIERTLTIDMVPHRKLADALVEMIEGWLELHDLGDAAGRRRRRDVLTSCRRSLERLFVEIRRDWPLAGLADRLSHQDKETNEAVMQIAAVEVGLTGLPDAIRHVKPGQIRAVSDYDDDWRLRPLVAATLLGARTDTNHPLRSAAEKAPDLLERIERVVALAGEAAPCRRQRGTRCRRRGQLRSGDVGNRRAVVEPSGAVHEGDLAEWPRTRRTGGIDEPRHSARASRDGRIQRPQTRRSVHLNEPSRTSARGP